MLRLPAEVLDLIFRNLHLKQKLECMLVCKTWAQILGDGCLFETFDLSVSSTCSSFNKNYAHLIQKASSGPGRKCNRLTLINETSKRVNGATLSISFPNLNYLSIREHIINIKEDPLVLDSIMSDPFQGWRSSLETFVGSCFVENHFLDFLLTGPFYRLSELTVLCFDLYNSDLSTRVFYANLITNLDNMPALTTLAIRSEHLSIVDLEKLHKNAPGLISLTLLEGFRTELEDLTLLKITPAANLKVFRTMEFYSDGPVLDTLLRYAILKYPHLEEYYHYETHHRHNFHVSTPIFSNTIWEEFIPAVGRGLKKCTIALKHKATVMFDFMEVYLNNLESLNVDVFKHKRVFNRVISKPAFLNLRSLSLRYLPPDFKMSDFKNLTQLKKLTLDLSRNSTKFDDGQLYTIMLNDIAKYLPKNVEELILDYSNLAVKQEDDKELQGDSSLIRIQLFNSHIEDENTSSYLSQHFTKLNSLTIKNCRIIHSLELPNHHLSYFYFVPADGALGVGEYTKENIEQLELENTHIKITASNHTRYYTLPAVEVQYCFSPDERIIHGHSYHIQKVLSASEYKEHLRYFYLKCASVKTAYFYGFDLLL